MYVADFDLNGGIAIGTSYANNGANPPSNGLLVQGNVGIGTTTPGSTLSVNNSLSVGATFANAAAGTNNLIVQGSVEVGTASPQARLHVANGNVIIDNSSSLLFYNGGGSVLGANARANDVTNASTQISSYGGIGFTAGVTSGSSTLVASSTSNLWIASTGNVAIGTTAPLSKLDVYGSVAIGTSYAGVTAAPTNGAIIQGNVGIGTASPITNSILSLSGHLGFYQAATPVVSSCGSGTAVAGSTDSKGQVRASQERQLARLPLEHHYPQPLLAFFQIVPEPQLASVL